MNDSLNIKVSAIIIGYNDEKRIGRAVESVLAQTYSNLEIIVVDDGSLDSTFAVMQKYESRGVTVLTKENGGAASARNFGVAHSSGEYIAFLDSDDIWMPEKIEKMVNALPDSENDYLVYSSYLFVDEKGNPFGLKKVNCGNDAYSLLLRAENPMLPSTMMVSRVAFDSVGGYPEDILVNEDCIFSILMCKRSPAIAIKEVLTRYSHSPNGKGRSAVFDYEKSKEILLEKFECVDNLLCQADFIAYKKSLLLNEFCKFAMYNQFASARRLLKDFDIPIRSLFISMRGILAIISTFTGIGFLRFCKNLYVYFFRGFYRCN